MNMKKMFLLAAIPAILSAQQPVAQEGAKPRMSTLPTSVSMIMLGVENVARSVAFYRDCVGLPVQSESPEFAFITAGAVTIGLNLPLGKTVNPRAGATELILPVASVTASKAALAARNCPFTVEPREVNTGTYAATFTDPDGHRLTLFGPR